MSLLTDFEQCADYLDWEIGVHGIYIYLLNPALGQCRAPSGVSGLGVAEDGTPSSASSSPPSSSGASTAHWSGGKPTTAASKGGFPFADEHHYLKATYLPEVMPAQGWTKVEAVDSAIRKAGWNGRITEDMRRGLWVRRYQSSKCTRRYDEWMEWRQVGLHAAAVNWSGGVG